MIWKVIFGATIGAVLVLGLAFLMMPARAQQGITCREGGWLPVPEVFQTFSAPVAELIVRALWRLDALSTVPGKVSAMAIVRGSGMVLVLVQRGSFVCKVATPTEQTFDAALRASIGQGL